MRNRYAAPVLLLLLAGLLTEPGTVVLAGDAKVAETLFKSGRQAFQKGDYAGAVTFFRKAQEENAGLVEACWWRGAALEKTGDKVGALEAWREYLTLFAEKRSTGGVSREEQRLAALAEKSVESMAAGEKELRKLEDGYVAALLAFAKENFLRDPGVSVAALDALLAVREGHEEALRLREKLGGARSAAPSPSAPATDPAGVGPFREVRTWKDLLADRTFKAPSVEYGAAGMVVDTRAGALITPADSIDLGTTFAYEFEFRVTETYERGWLTGLTFAGKSGRFLSAFANAGRVVLLRAESRDAQDEVASFDMPPLETGTWHRLGVVVRGPALEAWFDGRKVLEWAEPSGRVLDGEIGIFQQRCRTERRVFRAGRLE
jgi:hypothetical protein